MAIRTTAELEEQLRIRLRVIAIFGTLSAFGFAVVLLAPDWQAYVRTPGELFGEPYLGFFLIVGVFDVLMIAVLSPRRKWSLGQLRAIEWLLFTSAVAYPTIVFPSVLEELLGRVQGLVLIVAMSFSALWILLILVYGIMIPNTWRRCAAMIAFMIVCAMVPDVGVLLSSARVAPVTVWLYLGVKGVSIGMAAALAIYGSYRVDVLQQDALTAIQLGQYVLKEQIGAGGMGEVHLAEHQFLRRPCAVKLIRPGEHADASAIARFEREVQSTATLTHPNTVQIFDYGRTDDGTFYYAMEYLPGLSLDQLVEQHGPIPPARATHFLLQLCGALREAHSRGLIHRDIKPSNVIICERGGVHDVAKLLDFGLVVAVADETDSSQGKLTLAGSLVGTPAFMSPEQCGGEPLGPASDIYSLGALGYYLLSGRPPFAGRSPMQMLAAHIYEVPSALEADGAAVPAALASTIMRCLAKRPADRFADVTGLEMAVAEYAARDPWRERDAAEWWEHHAHAPQ